ncbi:hypothetical protein T439DRAFT_245866 [Meredithblackwellia eburnea MCA 4105]
MSEFITTLSSLPWVLPELDLTSPTVLLRLLLCLWSGVVFALALHVPARRNAQGVQSVCRLVGVAAVGAATFVTANSDEVGVRWDEDRKGCLLVGGLIGGFFFSSSSPFFLSVLFIH